MRGLRVSHIRKGVAFEIYKLENRLGADLSPDAVSAWLDAVQPLWLSEFSRFFGPLFPEILQRTWLLCDPGAPLLIRPFVDFYDMEEPVKVLEDLEALEIAAGEHWRIVRGEYLLRVANHIDEDELIFLGIPSRSWDKFWRCCERVETMAEMKKVARDFCDMAFCSYEGIWGAFFSDVKLLARTFFHCSEHFIVLEIEEGVGFDGDWLTSGRASCPAFPILLRRRERNG